MFLCCDQCWKAKYSLFSSVQLLSRVWLFATLWTPLFIGFSSFQFSHSIVSNSLRPHELQHARLPWLSVSQSFFKLMSIESVMPFNHLILCHLLLLLPSIFPNIRVFSSELSLCIRWPKYWVFNFSIGSSSENSGLISFRINWLDIFAIQETLKSLLQHHSSKAWILQRSDFFMPLLLTSVHDN